MKLDSLFKIQEIIESKIVQYANIDENALGIDNTFDLRFLALQIKTGELANLTKCYKYKYIPSPDNHEKLMIRFMDAMKFLLSIGNQHQFNIIDLDAIQGAKKTDELIPLFSRIYDEISALKNAVRQEAYIDAMNLYIKLFASYVNLGELFGFTVAQVFKAFESMMEREMALDRRG